MFTFYCFFFFTDWNLFLTGFLQKSVAQNLVENICVRLKELIIPYSIIPKNENIKIQI